MLDDLNRTLGAVGVGIAALDTELRYVFVNDAVEAIVGKPRDDIIGRTPEELVPPDVVEQTVPHLRRAMATGKPVRHDVYDPQVERWYEHRLYPSPAGIAIVFIDITDRKFAEHEQQRLLDAAESANRAKDEFFAILGHELRNPLSPILTALQLIKQRGDRSTIREQTVIERQVNQLTRLVDDLLDVSRIARGKVELKPEIVEVFSVISSAIEVATPLLESRAHTLTVHVPRTGLAVEGDAGRLRQVVSNLLTNAAKYTPPGGQISISAENEEGQVVIRVGDNGIGLMPDVLPHLFDMFVQGRRAVDRAEGGLGLGLSIVHNLVERHGGTVTVHSDGPDTGSEFVVRLPACEPERAPALAEEAQVAGAPKNAVRVLVVDDNPDAAEMLATALALRGHDVRVAHDGPEALRIATEEPPTLALLDIGLPVMDGYELAARLKELPGLDGVRLVAVTGYGQESDKRRSLEAGFHEHLVKPVDIDLLEELISG